MDEPRLRIVTGKGGVGKTLVAAGIALRAARDGKRVLLAEVDAGGQALRLLGQSAKNSDIVKVEENLAVVNMTPHASMHEYARLVLKFEILYRAVFNNRLVKQFIRQVPSLGELTMLGKIWYHEQETRRDKPRFDLIVLDAPATGHAISMLRAPEGVSRTVPPGSFRINCERMTRLLTDPQKTRMHIVTTPEEMPVNEAVELEQAASDLLRIPVGTTVINFAQAAWPPSLVDTFKEYQDAGDFGHFCQAMLVREARVTTGEKHLARLPSHMAKESIRLPRLPVQTIEREQLEDFADKLAPLLAESSA